MSFRFDTALELEQTGESRFVRRKLDDAWNINNVFFNGGYVHALTAAAALRVAEQPDIVSIATSFSNPVASAPAELEVDVLSAGRTVSSMQVSLLQDGQPRAVSLVTTGRLPSSVTLDNRHPMPDVPHASEIPDAQRKSRSSSMGDVMDLRLVPGYDGWTRKDYSRGAELMMWIRFRDDRPLDSLSVTAFSDMGPPVAFAQGNLGWAPTLQLHVGNFAAPTGKWLLMHATGSPYGGGPFGCEDVDLWDDTGVLVGRARQVALLPRRKAEDGRTGH